MKIEELRKAEREITEIIKTHQKAWIDKYGYAPDQKMSCFDVVAMLIKLGVIKDD